MKQFFILFLFFVFNLTALFSIQIDQITEITHDKTLLEMAIYNGAIQNFENRIFVETHYSKEEYIILETGEIERILFYENSFWNHAPSLINDSRYYTFNNFSSSKHLMIFDLSSVPMTLLSTIQLPQYFQGREIHKIHALGDYILISDYSVYTLLFNKNTQSFETPIQGFFYMEVMDNFIITPRYLTTLGSFADVAIEFYDFNLRDAQNPRGQLVHSFNLELDMYRNRTLLKIDGNLLYVMLLGYIAIFDVSDINNITNLITLEHDYDLNGDYYAYLDAHLYENYLLTYHEQGFRFYDITEPENIIISHEQTWDMTTADMYQMLIYDDKLFVNESTYIGVYDLKDNFHQMQRLGNATFHHSWNLKHLYFIEQKPHTSEIHFYSILNEEDVFKIDTSIIQAERVFVRDFFIKGDVLYTLMRHNNSNDFLNIYDIRTSHLFSSNPLPAGYSYLYLDEIGDYLILTRSNYELLRIMDIYEVIDYELEFVGSIESAVMFNRESYKPEGYFIVNNFGNSEIEFRSVTNPLQIINSFRTPHLEIGSQNMISKSLFSYEANGRLYFFSYDDNFTAINQTSSMFLNTNFDWYRNGFMTINSHYNGSVSQLYSFDNGVPRNIGHFQNPNVAVISLIYPEEKKLITLGPSSIKIYNIEYTTVSETDISSERSISLINAIENYPNPFNPETNIVFDLKEDGFVSIEIYNVRGQKIKSLSNEFRNSGRQQVLWNGTDDFGNEVGSGIYLYRIASGDFTQTKSMLLMK